MGMQLADLYKQTHVVCMNKEEAQQLLSTPETDFKILLDTLSALGPKITIITDGPHGTYNQKSKTRKYRQFYRSIMLA
jgi:sugar/nucleoside kinase (ribokinase family)